MCRLLVRRVCGLELDSSADAIAREAAEAVDMFLHGYGSRPGEQGEPLRNGA